MRKPLNVSVESMYVLRMLVFSRILACVFLNLVVSSIAFELSSFESSMIPRLFSEKWNPRYLNIPPSFEKGKSFSMNRVPVLSG